MSTVDYVHAVDLDLLTIITILYFRHQKPFYGRKRRDIVEQILECRFDFRGRRWRNISDQAKEFIRDLLVLDPKERFSAEEALAATWLNRRFAATTRAAAPEEEDQARTAMLRYAGYTKLKKMVRMGSLLGVTAPWAQSSL
jgi:calcium-dependent protein kinase